MEQASYRIRNQLNLNTTVRDDLMTYCTKLAEINAAFKEISQLVGYEPEANLPNYLYSSLKLDLELELQRQQLDDKLQRPEKGGKLLTQE
jgi:hypothetical protein